MIKKYLIDQKLNANLREMLDKRSRLMHSMVLSQSRAICRRGEGLNENATSQARHLGTKKYQTQKCKLSILQNRASIRPTYKLQQA